MKKEEYLEFIVRNDNKILNILSEEEHRLWKEFYEHNDWHYGPKRDDYKKIHNCLVGYHDPLLGEEERDKDRDQVKRYWDFLDRVGFGIVRE